MTYHEILADIGIDIIAKEFLTGKTKADIAETYDVSVSAVSHFLKKHNIRRNTVSRNINLKFVKDVRVASF